MKRVQKIFCSVLALMMLTSAFAGCATTGGQSSGSGAGDSSSGGTNSSSSGGGNSSSSGGGSGSSNSGNSGSSGGNVDDGREYTLVDNGISEYKIVLADETLYNERLAKDEIIEFFYEATGVELKSVTESEVTYSNDAKLIILGDTKFTENSGKDVDEIPTQGFTLKTVGTNLFILGEDYGVLYGAYEFLHQTFGFEAYAGDEIALDRNVKNLDMPQFDFSDSPDILYREPNYGPQRYNVTVSNRFRLHQNIWITEKGNFVHNSFTEYFPKDDYESAYPEFYSEKGTQLCYTARGNSTKLQAMQDFVVERMKYLINKYYSQGDFRESLSFTQEDNNDWCTCSSCKSLANKHGANSATLIKFINPVAKRVQDWVDQTWPGHTVNIAIFAYLKTEQAPTYDTSSLHLEDNVALFYAPFQADYFHDFSSSKNAGYMETMRKWMALADKMYLWFYSTNYRDYLIWYDSFNSMQPIYQLVKNSGGIYFFDQGRYNATSLTAFDMLKCYLNAKLAWDVDADYTKLINDFFNNYFREAAKPMMDYFNSFRSWSQYLKDNTSISGNVSTQISTASYWPKQILTGWEAYINEAYKAIEPLKVTDRVLYDKVYERIEKEGIAIRYHLYELHENTYEESELKALRQQFKLDATRLGFTKIREYGSLQDDVYSKWGV